MRQSHLEIRIDSPGSAVSALATVQKIRGDAPYSFTLTFSSSAEVWHCSATRGHDLCTALLRTVLLHRQFECGNVVKECNVWIDGVPRDRPIRVLPDTRRSTLIGIDDTCVFLCKLVDEWSYDDIRSYDLEIGDDTDDEQRQQQQQQQQLAAEETMTPDHSRELWQQVFMFFPPKQ